MHGLPQKKMGIGCGQSLVLWWNRARLLHISRRPFWRAVTQILAHNPVVSARLCAMIACPVKRETQMKRLGLPEEVAATICFAFTGHASAASRQ
jgi:hypothetical protein